MTFANIEYLLLLFLLVPYILWYIYKHKQSEPAMRVSDAQAYLRAGVTWRVRLRHLPFCLRVLTFVMIIMVLARPQTSNSWSNTDVEGIDIMMAMDISTSMLAEDLKPNRIEAAKEVAAAFIRNRPNDNIGLTVFAGEAFTQCPLTTDHAALLNIFNDVSCDMPRKGLIADGTTLGMGISNAVLRLKDSKAKSKVVILITDGVNNCGDISPQMAADIAKTFGIRIYTIAVGQNGTAPYPVSVAGMVQYVNMPVEVDAETLKRIAELTDGAYYRATDNESLVAVYDEIDKLEKTKFNVRKYSKRYEAYMVFALIAALSLLLEMLLRMTVLKRIP